MELLGESGEILFLDRSVAQIGGSDLSGRPLIAGNLERVQQLYDARISLYRKYAAKTFVCTAAPEQIAAEIAAYLKENWT